MPVSDQTLGHISRQSAVCQEVRLDDSAAPKAADPICFGGSEAKGFQVSSTAVGFRILASGLFGPTIHRASMPMVSGLVYSLDLGPRMSPVRHCQTFPEPTVSTDSLSLSVIALRAFMGDTGNSPCTLEPCSSYWDYNCTLKHSNPKLRVGSQITCAWMETLVGGKADSNEPGGYALDLLLPDLQLVFSTLS